MLTLADALFNFLFSLYSKYFGMIEYYITLIRRTIFLFKSFS